ncbi:MAG: transglutaminase domain-containing protein [Candidatus Gracilibacteria bacterium]|nr:transglutaminase domain-containing protein [Candidatus Gracilibacteria bacterium]
MNKKNILKKIIIFIIILCSIISADAKYVVEPKIEKLISNFLIKVEKKYSPEKEIIYLENINSKITNILENKKLNSKKEKLLNDILVLFNEKIFEIDYKLSLENISQKFIEAKIINDLGNNLSKIVIPNYIKNSGKKYYKISEDLEFIENNEIKKIDFTNYYSVNSSNINQYNNKQGIFAINNIGNIFFIENYKRINKIKYSQAKKIFSGDINYKTKFFKEQNTFYSYNFKDYKLFDDKYGFYLKTLEQNNINPQNAILYYSKNQKYNFIIKHTKIKLINSDIIYGIVDKKDFLDDLVNDKLYLTGDTDNLFIELKSEVQKLVKNKNKEEKIKIIYNFILNNVEYTKDFKISDKKIFSGILSYKNKNGVCEGYAKLASYSLKFAGIKDARIIRGDVIDAQDFPKIGHAWLKIGKLYYDPTFDDPIGQNSTKEFNEYKYFGLPKDLLYANRFDY